MKTGPYVVLPFFGPSDVRDALGKVPEYFADPRYFIKNPWVEYPLWAVGIVNARVDLLPLDPTVDSAYDPYALTRNVYLQNRDFKVNGGTRSSEEDERERLLFEEAAQDDAPAATPKPATAPPK